MKDGFIAVIDSGIGGMSALLSLVKLMPNERYLYFSDSKNLPYGNKDIEELWRITKQNLNRILRYNIKVLVVGCNTLSVNLLEQISAYSKVKTFGVFPPINLGLNFSKNTLLLSTNSTAKKCLNNGVDILALRTLAQSVERYKFNLDKIEIDKELKNSVFYSDKYSNFNLLNYNTLILGCTHYFFVKNEISNHFRPLKIYCGEECTAQNVLMYLHNSKSLVNSKRFYIKFIGADKKMNKEFWKICGQRYKKL